MSNSLKPLQSPASTTGGNYTDFNGLAALKKDPSSPQAIHAVARQIDALFLQMMLKSMRDASAAMGQADSNEMDMYHDMFDKQIALSLSQTQSLGLGAQLTRQLAGQAAAPMQQVSAVAVPPTTDGGSKGGMTTGGVTTGDASAPAGAVQPIATQGVPAPGEDSTPAQFISQIFPAIQRAAQSLGVNPFAMLAQAVLETGWGRRMARSPDGRPSLNMFGIKADVGWTGARMAADTLEFSGGVATQRRTSFRAYGSIEDSVGDFARLLANSPRYRDAVAAGGDAAAYIAAIGKSGYASDPEYANKLNEVMRSAKFRGAVLAHTLSL